MRWLISVVLILTACFSFAGDARAVNSPGALRPHRLSAQESNVLLIRFDREAARYPGLKESFLPNHLDLELDAFEGTDKKLARIEFQVIVRDCSCSSAADMEELPPSARDIENLAALAVHRLISVFFDCYEREVQKLKAELHESLKRRMVERSETVFPLPKAAQRLQTHFSFGIAQGRVESMNFELSTEDGAFGCVVEVRSGASESIKALAERAVDLAIQKLVAYYKQPFSKPGKKT